MTRKHLSNYLHFFILIFLLQSIFSCNSTKKIKYFQDIRDSGQVKNIPKVDYLPITIRTGDILNINIQTINPTSSSMINSGNLTAVGPSSAPGGTGASGILAALSGGNQTQQQVTGFLVDDEGFIEMPLLGRLKAAGYSTDQLKAIVADMAAKYFKDMTVAVRLINFKVSVIGEVLKPGQYIMPAEKENIMDAISMAGDLTIFGKRENVLLIRENLDGTKTTYRLNLTHSDVLSSPLYYLRQNDVIYVEPRKAKSDINDASQVKYAGIIAAILSIIIIIATRVK